MLIDEVRLTVIAGHGGSGIVSFHSDKSNPKGGPDGGNGGNGGNVYLQGIDNIRYLKKYREQVTIEGHDGEKGGKNKRTGASGTDTLVYIPVGSRVYDRKRNKTVEILDTAHTVLIARGGKGGRGNYEFRSATLQAPRIAEPGTRGERVELDIRLLLIADIGLIGLPNAGKSSLLNALTRAHAHVADYPFTTLEPNLGRLGNKTIADLPGLIEGASAGKGLGIAFLKHIERTRMLIHCIACDSADIAKDYEKVRAELRSFNPALISLPEVLVITKSDLMEPAQLKVLMKHLPTQNPIYAISIIDDESLETIRTLIQKQ